MRLATCSYREFVPAMGTPVRFTVGHPRFRLPYHLAGQATLITPTWAMLKLPQDAYTLTYRRRLDAAGVDAIRTELARIAGQSTAARLVLLCFDDLSQPDGWCHRTTFGRWWSERTGEPVPELGAHTANQTSPLF